MSQFKGQTDEQVVQFRMEIQDIKNVVKQIKGAMMTSLKSEIQNIKHKVESKDVLMTALESENQNIKREVEIKGALMTNLMTEIGRLKSELKNKIDQRNVGISETTFEYELTNLVEFFRADNVRNSEVFYCRGLPFSIEVQFRKKDDQPKCLGLYLHCNHSDPVKWSCKTNSKLRLVSFLPDVPDEERKLNAVFTKDHGFGFSKFILLSELMNEKNGFIRNNTIKLVCELKADKLIRPQ